MQLCNIVFFKNLPIFTQLSYEEALLRADSDNWCIINQGSPPALVLGIANDIQEHVAKPLLPIIRRFSGGGSVVVDEQTFFISFILRNDENIKNPKAIMAATFNILAPAFSSLDFRHIETDYTIGTTKIAGSALSITKERLLHHISFLFDFDEERLAHLAHPPTEPEYRNGRSHTEFLGKLNRYFPTMDVLQEKLLFSLQQKYSLLEKSEHDLQTIAKIPHRKALHLCEKL